MLLLIVEWVGRAGRLAYFATAWPLATLIGKAAPAASSRLSETRLLRDRVAMGDGQGSGLDVQVDNHVGLHNFRFMDLLHELSRDPGQGGFH